MTGTQCGLFTHKSVPVIFESPCIIGGCVIVLHCHVRFTYLFPVRFGIAQPSQSILFDVSCFIAFCSYSAFIYQPRTPHETKNIKELLPE
jgi:hypothetical protein